MFYDLLPYLLALFFAGVLVHLWRKPKPAVTYGRDDGQADVQPDPYRTIAADARAHASRQGRDYRPGDARAHAFSSGAYRPGEIVGGYGGHTIRTAAEIERERLARKNPHPFGKRTVPPVKKPVIALTPRMIERVNIERRHAGRPPLNRDGIKNAIAHPFDRPEVRQPSTTNDWLTYLIVYECLLADHQQSHVSGTGGFTIDPNIPYNGQGGEFAGAGASGDWTNAPVTAATVADGDFGRGGGHLAESIAMGVAAGAATAASYPAPDPTPSYSAPDPSPSYSSSSDSSSSSSSSSDSGSSSGGGDSGGGGGGGGE